MVWKLAGKMETKRILERLGSLISMGETVIKSTRDNYEVEGDLFHQWRTSSLALLSATLGPESVHYREFEECCKKSLCHQAIQGLGILKAVREDIAGGYLQKVEMLVSASVFSDFLEMAEHLLDNGFKDPAASLIGAVLEDGLRRICRNNDLPVKSDDNISSLNRKLADKDVYNRLQQREIEVWNKLRDYADHGHFDEYKIDNVKDMLEGVQKFLSGYLK